MKFKKNLKRFWTLSRRQDGFTLVELIVVIAILAILAGVAVPAYSGYVKKADRAADEVLLNSLNTAFASACLNNGENNYFRTDDPTITLDDGVAARDALNTANDNVDASFEDFFEGGTFKVFDALYYSKTAGGFKNDEVKLYTYTDANGNEISISVSQSTIEAFANSTWGTSVSAGQLLSLVGDVTTFAGTVDNATFLALLESEGFAEAAAEILGVEDYYDATDSMVDELMIAWEAENPSATQDEWNAQKAAYLKQIDANTAVLVAAKNAQAASSDIMSILSSGTAKTTIKDTMATDPATGLSQAALAYGMYTSYLYSTGKADPADGAPNAVEVLNSLNSTTNSDFANFQAYLQSAQGQQDMEGYLAALNTVGNNSGVASDVVINGYNTAELESLLGQIMGG